ncbi:MAG TPA: hypothetical protein VNK95_16045 [Caldilineaceae bacterium]|nr:hypothetical protein [Caldilineaceae bacterium]
MPPATKLKASGRRLLKKLLAIPPRLNFSAISAAPEWCDWAAISLQRLPVPYWLMVAAFAMLAVIEQLVEHGLRDPLFERLSTERTLALSAVPVMFVYVLLALPLLKNFTIGALQQLRPVIQINDREYNEHVRQMVCIGPRVELVMLAVSACVILLLLIVARAPTPMGGGEARLPRQWLPASLILVVYTLLGWLLLLLLYSSIRLGRGLDALAQRPLTINVFDSTRLLPFGQLSLRHSLTVAGLILVLVIPLGRPTEIIDYMVIALLSLGSLLSLILPLRGVRLQVRRAKTAVLHHLSDQFQQIQTTLINEQQLDQKELEGLSKSAQELDNIRRLVLSGPDWPFRNATATLRAVLTAISPLLYFVITELIRLYLMPLLIG